MLQSHQVKNKPEPSLHTIYQALSGAHPSKTGNSPVHSANRLCQNKQRKQAYSWEALAHWEKRQKLLLVFTWTCPGPVQQNASCRPAWGTCSPCMFSLCWTGPEQYKTELLLKTFSSPNILSYPTLPLAERCCSQSGSAALSEMPRQRALRAQRKRGQELAEGKGRCPVFRV